MVARRDDGLATRLVQPDQKVVVLFCGLVGWVVLVKNIASHQQQVNLILLDMLQQPLQKLLHVLAKIFQVQSFSQVPVCSDQYFHRFLLVLLQYHVNG